MNLNIRAVGLTAGIVWGACMLLTALADAFWGYGSAFLTMMDGLYPGYAHDGSVWSAIVGMLYGFLDGLIAGAVFAWLYNKLASKAARST